MCTMSSPNQPEGFDSYRSDIDDVERRVAGEFDAGARALVVAVLVFLVLVSLLLPHTGAARGFDVLAYTDVAEGEAVALPSRVFTVLAVVFSVGFSTLALLTRRWAIAWVALAGSAVACVIGMLAVWSRQTVAEPYPGPGIGLVLGWLAVIVLTFHWARVVWTRTALQMAAEEERRRLARENQGKGLLDLGQDRRPDSDQSG
ncbi:PGPGW domain-containing protein [Mycobacterium sp. SMC-4]|uniref:PGPGW domain-containing protein n=1 Tax=Mycobacterium sp. SMC-4 TaxID=2857059 RepID=UPI0021B36112|nr:PGPGW domain-containing protein [Mycobacterium sp. SMC-4]UXA19978.1 PGPGW domain-containing protein [Mycobacterium sp. SMC-4]